MSAIAAAHASISTGSESPDGRNPRSGARLSPGDVSSSAGGNAPASSLSDLIRGMRCRQTGMDARRTAQAMVVPLPSGATPQTPGLATTLRDGVDLGASRCCASSLGGHPSFVGAPCAASQIDPVAPTKQVRQAASSERIRMENQGMNFLIALASTSLCGLTRAASSQSFCASSRLPSDHSTSPRCAAISGSGRMP